MNKKTINIINAILIAISFALSVVYDRLGNPYVFKSLATGWFLIVAVFNFIVAIKQENKPKAYKILMLIGLVFAAAGDIFLIKNSTFVLGAMLFAVGHVFYLSNFFVLHKFKIRDLFIFAGLFGVCLLIILLYPNFNFNGMFAIIIVYALIISAMLAKAISNCFEKQYQKQNIAIAVGALLFFISDVCLLFYVFGGAPVWVDSICLFTYYTGQGLLASSLSFVNREK